MSNVSIKRAVENIRANTTVYTPVIEMIVNGLQAKVQVRAHRGSQIELDGSLPDVIDFDIEDNSIGFADAAASTFYEVMRP